MQVKLERTSRLSIYLLSMTSENEEMVTVK